MKDKKKKKLEFSKIMIIQESILIFIITIGFIGLAYIAMQMGYEGSLPWLAALPSVAWAAYGVSQAFYYKKAQAENTSRGVVFETAMIEAAAEHAADKVDESLGDNNEMPEVPIIEAPSEPDPFGPM